MSALVPFDNWNEYRKTALKRVEGKDLTGNVYVITGATGTLGKEITVALASAGATVIFTGRSLEKLEKAKASVLERGVEIKGNIEPFTLDLNDYDSIETFVKELKKKYPKVDVLINNAGMIPGFEYKESKYGLETTFQANFVSTVLLTELMIPLMKEGGRFVHVSSLSHADASKPFQWNVVPSTKETFGGYNKDYAESKWLLTTYSSALNKRLESTHKGSLQSVCADPGISPDSTMWDQQTFVIRFMARYVFKFLTKTSPQAAACTTAVAVMEDVQGGGYYHSGILYPAMRPDCDEPENWAKMVECLDKVLPKKYKKYAVAVAM